MAKAEWGLKRTCQTCGAKFYDLSRSPIVCPKCGATFDPDLLLKAKRAKPAAKAVVVPAEPEPAEPELAAGTEEKEEEEEAVMEDTSELGRDADDVGEVVDNAQEGGEER